MKIEEFQKAIEEDDFSVGDSFWLGDFEFEVVSKRGSDEVVFKWQLTRQEFIEIIKETLPKVQEPEKVFDENKDDILEYFAKAFDLLISDCGATYRTITADVVDEVLNGCDGVNKNEC
jgi:hypothetical protein